MGDRDLGGPCRGWEASETMLMIEAKALARTFKTRRGNVEAVRGVDFTVQSGEIVGFLGPNGAGKTTTLRLLTTLLTPTSGSAQVAGCDLIADPEAVRRKIGYVAQGGVSAPDATVSEELVFQAQLYRISATEARHRAELLCKELDLAGLESRRTGTLSGGQRRRLDIALGLVHSPPLIFLDEPTAGLDPQARANLWDHIRRLRDEHHTTIFLTTHYLEEADALCDRILVIDHGKIVAEGSPEELKRRVSGDVIAVSITGEGERAREICRQIARCARGCARGPSAAANGRKWRRGIDECPTCFGRRSRTADVDSAFTTHARRCIPDADRPIAARR